MIDWRKYHLVLAVFAIVGMILSPMIVPYSGSAMAAEIMTAMPEGDMDCCPQEQPAAPDCQKACPMMISCTAKCSSGQLFISTLIVPSHIALEAASIGNNFPGSSHGEEPPARPPRT